MALFDRLGVAARRIFYTGSARHCPLCGGAFRKFLRYGRGRRPDARCPGCGSLERHRFAWRVLTSRGLLEEIDGRFLHVAPEPALRRKLEDREALEYVTADLQPGRAMVRMDITDIRYPDATFGAIYCSHVLEHVPDDRRAMREFHRVLRPGGWALIAVPLTAEQTVEDPSIEDPAERARLFGQHDHVRRYGPDVQERLEEAGFRVERIDPEHLAGPRERERMALTGGQPLYLCRKDRAG